MSQAVSKRVAGRCSAARALWDGPCRQTEAVHTCAFSATSSGVRGGRELVCVCEVDQTRAHLAGARSVEERLYTFHSEARAAMDTD